MSVTNIPSGPLCLPGYLQKSSGSLRHSLKHGDGNPRHRVSGLAARLLKFQSLKSIERLHEELIFAGTVTIRLGVQEAAQFTPVHLIHQFTKLGALPLTKSRGFPAPYLTTSLRVPGGS